MLRLSAAIAALVLVIGNVAGQEPKPLPETVTEATLGPVKVEILKSVVGPQPIQILNTIKSPYYAITFRISNLSDKEVVRYEDWGAYPGKPNAMVAKAFFVPAPGQPPVSQKPPPVQPFRGTINLFEEVAAPFVKAPRDIKPRESIEQTLYWRVPPKPQTYIEIELPGAMAGQKDVFKLRIKAP